MNIVILKQQKKQVSLSCTCFTRMQVGIACLKKKAASYYATCLMHICRGTKSSIHAKPICDTLLFSPGKDSIIIEAYPPTTTTVCREENTGFC